MKFSKSIFLLIVLVLTAVSVAETASHKEAEKLLSTMGMEHAFEQSISQMLDIQLQQNPALAPYKKVMLEFFAKHMSYESLKPDMVKIYSDAFSTEELKELNAFYATATGKKTIEKMPTLMAQGGQIGATRVQENIGELQVMIQAEAARIQNLQSH